MNDDKLVEYLDIAKKAFIHGYESSWLDVDLGRINPAELEWNRQGLWAAKARYYKDINTYENIKV